jgi:hypothetical protein
MRLSSLFSVAFVVAIAVGATIIACGSSGGNNNGADAKVYKDAPGSGSGSGSGSANPNPDVTAGLGQLCPAAQGGAGSACGSADECVLITGLGSTTTGYCTPNCAGSNAGCTTGYTGPAGGQPVCALTTGSGSGSGSGATGCAIVCTGIAQCPGGMQCVVAQGTTMICVPQ